MKFGNENSLAGNDVVQSGLLSDAKAVIFDMDGVLLDSESICDKTWEIAAKEKGLSNYYEVIQNCRGRNKTDSVQIIKKFYGEDFDSVAFLQRTSELFLEIEKKSGIDLMYYAKEILDYLKPRYRIALASSTRGETVARQLTNLGLLHYFETRTTGDMVKLSKPKPEIYQLACASLGLRCEDCIAIEDSPNGVKSAVAAGMRVIMIPDKIQPDEELKASCWKICKNLEEVKNIL